MKVHGYTLLELMVAMAAGMFLLAGVSMSYSAIKSTIVVTQELSHAQEVVRYTSQVFTRSIKQTNILPRIENNGSELHIDQDAQILSCQGTIPASAYTELYTLNEGYLVCSVTLTGNPASVPVNLLRGVQALNFTSSDSGLLIKVTVTPDNVPTQFADGIDIDIAVTRMIMADF
ncbi:PilW family protein [Pseudoalteromonas sp. MMG012]|uniref:PilW family protein n=1 Tax=Pseudoalteromonas sp. MMG012 TaxID=2822686 RepID=UPI001B3A4014|nr:prepilin-type N-terminal cleavage/methylation domain-containing protein [Pseudoalteromonas sp. MMG012]MBQ4848512.1 prepilin-type N-terminal cleavage/methylation domain-containing protein [Pseudoalteromonas sp. MMG012]